MANNNQYDPNFWTQERNDLFQQLATTIPITAPDRYEQIARSFPGRTVGELHQRDIFRLSNSINLLDPTVGHSTRPSIRPPLLWTQQEKVVLDNYKLYYRNNVDTIVEVLRDLPQAHRGSEGPRTESQVKDYYANNYIPGQPYN
ncbi:hypothetical protein TSUD_286530 [Trifolium subterraneum]|uniref:Myb-like domain-containing protein n=1 Tax=Trifolium subterraneum TaxID=3900 RepID=A0A2Z6NZI4_TRISU|nr:hypothetical protein TSUD_286530 [Trifolium subterraneum]